MKKTIALMLIFVVIAAQMAPAKAWGFNFNWIRQRARQAREAARRVAEGIRKAAIRVKIATCKTYCFYGNCDGNGNCKCNVGFQGFRCTDKNECNTRGICPTSNGRCINTQGSYQCRCNSGYQLEGRTCRDINECTSGAKCDHSCINFPGSFRCTCNTGFALSVNKRTCRNVNECLENTHDCDHICDDTIGSYTCSCKDGYMEIGNKCEDINECENGVAQCQHFCNDTEGSYFCSCDNGYLLNEDGYTCKDINECIETEHGCEQECLNNEGSFICTCDAKHYLAEDQKNCNEILNEWTFSQSSCQCYFDKRRFDCPCCLLGGCQCPHINSDKCVQCGYGDTCDISIEEEAAACKFNNSKLGINDFLASCDLMGRYLPKQCDQSGKCWCVDTIGRFLDDVSMDGKCRDYQPIDGWTMRGSSVCDYDESRSDCARCRRDGCQCRNGVQRCVQCGHEYVCDEITDFSDEFIGGYSPLL